MDSDFGHVSHLRQWAAAQIGRPEEGTDVLLIEVSRPAEHVCLMTVAGELDMLSAPELDSAIVAQLELRPTLIILDLRKIEFLGSAGLATLMAARESAARIGAVLRLVCTGPVVLRPIDLTGLTELFEVYPDPEAACRC